MLIPGKCKDVTVSSGIVTVPAGFHAAGKTPKVDFHKYKDIIHSFNFLIET